ncbi:MAG TPA: 2OG-Fe(II) oxygenase family protein [Steroidobacteraceae bacterium]
MKIPEIDIAGLFGTASPARAEADRALIDAACGMGFLLVTGLPDDVPVGDRNRRELLRLFELPDSERRTLWRRKFDPAHPNVYRGWFPAQNGDPTHKEGMDIGPDLVYGAQVVDPSDVLREATPLPPEATLPGWRTAAASYYRAMERTAAALMRSVARGLGLPEATFDAAFFQGVSTLRLIRYPVRTPESFGAAGSEQIWVMHHDQRRHLIGRPHVDSGSLTLVAQDETGGLQARSPQSVWVDVPPTDRNLVVNFGKVMERWTGGRVKATEHRVIGNERERFSIPFFYEPRVDAQIAPLNLDGAETFEPFLFGDHLWTSIIQFVEFRGLEQLRRPKGRA